MGFDETRGSVNKRYALVPDRVWDGISDDAKDGLAVIVNDEFIEGVVDREHLPENLYRINLPGCTALPGFVDAHCHLNGWMGPSFLAAGVTTVLDVGNDLNWILKLRETSEKEPDTWPTVMCTGFLLDGPKPFHKHIGYGTRDADELRRMIRHQIELGVDTIKLYVGLGPNELRVGCEEAHSLGKKVLAHLGLASASEAARAGVDQIMHLTGCKPAWEKRPRKSTEALGRVFLKRGTVLNSTFLVWDRLARPLSLEFVYDGRRKWLSPAYQDLWHSEETRSRNMLGRIKEQRSFILMKEFLAAMYEMDVPIIAGSDAPFPHLIPGFSLHDELVAIADIGLSPLQVLRMATSQSAEALGLGNIGQLAKGMYADIAVFEGDPTADLTLLGETRLTVHRGCCVNPEVLFDKIRILFMDTDDSPVTQLVSEHVNR